MRLTNCTSFETKLAIPDENIDLSLPPGSEDASNEHEENQLASVQETESNENADVPERINVEHDEDLVVIMPFSPSLNTIVQEKPIKICVRTGVATKCR